ncbi:MAG TPA: hypothetical protein PKZ82_13045 [Microthrixaceae bacterium]|nr:hypothetical protein [Microthrixaceae bacterium]HNH97048.1 hypothetical protein [Microthrixaceae bacterium]HNJ23698.1 hypothetical protein [Microthrixaceae bacterium]
MNPTVHRAPVAPATAGDDTTDTADTDVGPDVRATFAVTGARSDVVDTATGYDPAFGGFPTSSITNCNT